MWCFASTRQGILKGTNLTGKCNNLTHHGRHPSLNFFSYILCVLGIEGIECTFCEDYPLWLKGGKISVLILISKHKSLKTDILSTFSAAEQILNQTYVDKVMCVARGGLSVSIALLGLVLHYWVDDSTRSAHFRTCATAKDNRWPCTTCQLLMPDGVLQGRVGLEPDSFRFGFHGIASLPCSLHLH